MKTEYRPIAMRCNQEQFESIKDRIPNEMIIDITPFFHHDCITNFFRDNQVSNISYGNGEYRGIKIQETFDAELFLDCCGREKEDVPIMQVKFRGEWCDYVGEYRIKPQPDYSKEIEALQQKAKENGMSVTILFEKL